MSTAVEKVEAARARARALGLGDSDYAARAEVHRQAGVRRNEYTLPAGQSTYFTDAGPVVLQGDPVLSGVMEVPGFDREAFAAVLARHNGAELTFEQFLSAAWEVGVVRCVADFEARTVTYYGADGGKLVETYPAVELPDQAQAQPAS